MTHREDKTLTKSGLARDKGLPKRQSRLPKNCRFSTPERQKDKALPKRRLKATKRLEILHSPKFAGKKIKDSQKGKSRLASKGKI